MKQPKKLHPAIEYSCDIFVPDIDMDLDEFITIQSEHLDSHITHENLGPTANHIGTSVFITEDIEIDPNQFEEKVSKEPINQKGLFFQKNH